MVKDFNLRFCLKPPKCLGKPDGEDPCPKRIGVDKTRHLNKKKVNNLLFIKLHKLIFKKGHDYHEVQRILVGNMGQ